MSEVQAPHRELVAFVRQMYGAEGAIPLHAPVFRGNEKRYLADCIDTTYVSSVGAYVDRFETMMCEITGAAHAVATVNGTAALHMALIVAGVREGDEVITQPLSFVATCNALAYHHAHPVFVDVDADSLSLSPDAVSEFLEDSCVLREGECRNRRTGRRVSGVVLMHTFGLPGRAAELAQICERWGLALIEDAAESLGSWVGDRHTGTIGPIGTFSFNGNKTVTSGGGGCLVMRNAQTARLAKHLTTTAKLPHRWDFDHDQVGYNYRMPNLNAALACAQLEQLAGFLANKRETAARYARQCAELGIAFVQERPGTTSNYWLNAILTADAQERDAFLAYSNSQGVMTRPVWKLMTELPAFAQAERGPLDTAESLAARVVNLPSSVRPA
jgi:perosamine synthetase